jgi:hypothetical protein
MSTDTPHHPLGWPPGSVRGLLALLIAVECWLLLLLPAPHDPAKQIAFPLTLYFLLSNVFFFLVSHGGSVAGPSDPTAPRITFGGVSKVLIVGGTAGVVALLYANQPERFSERLRPTEAQMNYWPTVLGAYVGGFFVGYVFRHMPFRDNWMFQAFLAWIAMIAAALMFVEIIFQAFIRPGLKDEFDLQAWGAAITAIVTSYFATRS